MQNNATYFKHSICLSLVFLLSGFMLSKILFDGSIASLLLAFILSLVLFLKCEPDLSVSKNKLINGLFVGLFICFCFICLTVCQNDYIVFIDKIRLPNTLAVVLSGIFTLLALYLGRQNEKIIFTFSVFIFIVSVFAIVLLFVFSIPLFDFKMFVNDLNFDILKISSGAMRNFAFSFGQLIIIAVFLKQNNRFSVNRILIGAGFGFVILLILLLNVVLVLDMEIISQLEYPYPTVSGILTIGRSQSRVDGLLYFVYFACALIKSSVIYNVIIKLLRGYKRIFSTITVTAITILSVILSASHQMNDLLNSNPIAIILVVLEIIILFVFITNSLKRRIG